jgi:hypothetical protein
MNGGDLMKPITIPILALTLVFAAGAGVAGDSGNGSGAAYGIGFGSGEADGPGFGPGEGEGPGDGQGNPYQHENGPSYAFGHEWMAIHQYCMDEDTTLKDTREYCVSVFESELQLTELPPVGVLLCPAGDALGDGLRLQARCTYTCDSDEVAISCFIRQAEWSH